MRCCGALMVGTKAKIQAGGIVVADVPFLVCPVCGRGEIHPKVYGEFEIIEEMSEHIESAFFSFDEVATVDWEALKESVPFWVDDEEEVDERLLAELIDHTLDLYGAAEHLADEAWSGELRRRFAVLATRYRDRLAFAEKGLREEPSNG
ncbi:MAG: hypothetical protein BLITH_0306 [Brockia lithotrophica]|uniref:YgiT-type zinc finger domain-containing protein n=1 Tax=Brockia lithotrophica TaxID=933949 RepID=A0A2T5GAK5_9BACL|nr:hypothetical protein [Brockia lithotrophica]PTQ53226.1 MAG: hypothetical protein BLITH_0306 [Brockia lithotrophica]